MLESQDEDLSEGRLQPALSEPDATGERGQQPRAGEDEGLRFSLAGAQLKFSVLNRGQRVTLPGRGEQGQWIVKLDAAQFPSMVENEYATLKWAEQAGFDVPVCKLRPRERLQPSLRKYAPPRSRVLLVERYDREGAARIHQEDFAQVVGLRPRMKYEQVKYEQLAVLARAIAGKRALEKVVRRLVFMVASGNFDAHLKNWSLRYPDGIHAQLAPLYDQVCVVAWEEIKPEWALKLAGGRDPYQVRSATFERLAERAGCEPNWVLKIVDETLDRIVEAWALSEAPDAMPEAHARRLQRYWERVPLLEKRASPF